MKQLTPLETWFVYNYALPWKSEPTGRVFGGTEQHHVKSQKGLIVATCHSKEIADGICKDMNSYLETP